MLVLLLVWARDHRLLYLVGQVAIWSDETAWEARSRTLVVAELAEVLHRAIIVADCHHAAAQPLIRQVLLALRCLIRHLLLPGRHRHRVLLRLADRLFTELQWVLCVLIEVVDRNGLQLVVAHAASIAL